MTFDMPATVHLVDDEAPVRDALGFLFHTHGMTARAHALGPEFMAVVDAAPKAEPLRGCIVLDVRMEPLSGLQVRDELIARGITLPVIFLSGHGDIPMAVDALQKGAFDFAEKPFSDDTLVWRVQRALAREAQLHTARGDDERVAAHLGALTEREHEVMHQVAAGKLNKVIADELGIAVRTVEVHRARVFAKLGVRSAAQVATLLARHGGPASQGA